MPDELKIISNNQERLILNSYELTPKERADFDYLDWTKLDEGSDSASFVRYKGRVYDLGEFLAPVTPGLFTEWSGYSSDSFFSGILVRFTDDDHVVMGWFMS